MVSWILYLNIFTTPSALKCKSLFFPLMSEIKLPKCWHIISVHFTALSDALSEPPRSMTETGAGEGGGGGGVDAVNGNKFTSAWGRSAHPPYIYFVTCSEKIPSWGRVASVAGPNEVYKDYLFQLKIMPGAMQWENICKLHKNRMVQRKLTEDTPLLLLFTLLPVSGENTKMGKTAENAMADSFSPNPLEPLTWCRIPRCVPCARRHRNRPRQWDSGGTTARTCDMERNK